MIRLAVAGGADAAWAEVARRLRGVTLSHFHDASPPACDAVAIFGPGVALIDHVLSLGHPVLLCGELCTCADDLERWAAAARHAGAALGVFNPDRYLPSRQLIRRACERQLGAVGLVRLHRWLPAGPAAPPPGPPLLLDLDSAQWLVGRTVNAVFAVAHPGGGAQVHLGFAGGAMALITCAGGLPPGDGYRSLSVIGASGAAYHDDHHNTHLLYRGGAAQTLRADEGAAALAATVQDLADAVRSGRDLWPGVAAWRGGALAVADAVRRSAETGQAVHLEGH